jgi:hypothetical protein
MAGDREVSGSRAPEGPGRFARRALLGAAAGLAAGASAGLLAHVPPSLAPGMPLRAWHAWRRRRARARITGEIVGSSHQVGHRLRAGAAGEGQSQAAAAAAAALPVADVTVLVIGAGISGLAAGWKLAASGIDDFVVLDLEPRPGGTSASGEAAATAYPWGAHYVPLPPPEARTVRELFAELGVIAGYGAPGGDPIYTEEYLCFAPQERLFFQGQWQDGLFPSAGASHRDREQLRRFRELMAAYRGRRGCDGRKAFAIPMELSSRDPELLALDRISMHELLARHGLDSPRLRWYVEYACRDDFGCDLATTSAWAGVHYYAARPLGEEGQVLTWPEGNGWIVRQLERKLRPRLRSRAMALSLDAGSGVGGLRPPSGRGRIIARVLDVASGATTTYRASAAILAVPKFVARRIVRGWDRGDPARDRATDRYTYSPWMVANLHVDRVPAGRGAPPAWDNVIHGSPSLGYIVATHQHLNAHPGESVLTYYRPFPDADPAAARARMLSTRWDEWRDAILDDLARAHPDIEERVRRLDVMLWGHAMVRPTVGFIWGGDREKVLAPPAPGLALAHSDSSGLPLFEEAVHRGVQAAEATMDHLGHRYRSSL